MWHICNKRKDNVCVKYSHTGYSQNIYPRHFDEDILDVRPLRIFHPDVGEVCGHSDLS